MNASTQTELDTLKAKLAARDGRPGFEDNVKELRKRIAELEGTNGEQETKA